MTTWLLSNRKRQRLQCIYAMRKPTTVPAGRPVLLKFMTSTQFHGDSLRKTFEVPWVYQHKIPMRLYKKMFLMSCFTLKTVSIQHTWPEDYLYVLTIGSFKVICKNDLEIQRNDQSTTVSASWTRRADTSKFKYF